MYTRKPTTISAVYQAVYTLNFPNQTTGSNIYPLKVFTSSPHFYTQEVIFPCRKREVYSVHSDRVQSPGASACTLCDAVCARASMRVAGLILQESWHCRLWEQAVCFIPLVFVMCVTFTRCISFSLLMEDCFCALCS